MADRTDGVRARPAAHLLEDRPMQRAIRRSPAGGVGAEGDHDARRAHGRGHVRHHGVVAHEQPSPGHERGRFRNGWLDARFSFSFGAWRDPAFDHYSDLVVLNDDTVAPGGGFAEHGHEDMEVMSYPLVGAVEHRDSLGNVATMRPGDVHLMRAGRGIRHSEMNASADEGVHFLQIWLLPNERGIEPGYEQKTFPREEKQGRLRLVASPEASEGSVTIHADARLYVGLLDGDDAVVHPLAKGRGAYVHVARGGVVVNGEALAEGDAIAIEDEESIRLERGASAEVLVFDLG